MLSAALVGGAISCDREPASPKAPTASATIDVKAPATLPSHASPSTQPAQLASGAVIMIDQRNYDFPAARLRVSEVDGQVVALLHSDDPRDAIDEKYAGNSFYLQMDLDVPAAADFSRTEWRFAASTSEPSQSPYGIFLEGHRYQLQPVDLKVSFERTTPATTTVWMSGRMLLIDIRDSASAPRMVSLAARLPAKTILKD